MESSIVYFVLVLFVVVMAVFALLFWILKTALHTWEVKNCVDVDIYPTGEHFQKRESFNCMKIKKNDKNSLQQFELKQLFGKKVFPFYEKFAMTRQKDGKIVANFVELNGKHVPFIPGAKIEYIDKDVKDKTIKILSMIDNHDKIFTKEYQDEIVTNTMRDGHEKFVKNVGQKQSGWSAISIILIGVAGVIIIGYFIWKSMKKGG